MKIMRKPTPEMEELFRRCGDFNEQTSALAQKLFAKAAIEIPLRRGVLKGYTLDNIFEEVYFAPGTAVEFPLDFLTSSNVNEFVAYTIPYTGKLPHKNVEGDYLAVPTYPIGASIDWPLRYARDARWDVLARYMQVMEAQFVAKENFDGWHAVLAAAAGRNIVTYDAAATAGLFTKRLIALMKTVMRRNAGGNYASLGKGKLTDLYMSPESVNDAFSWDLTQVDDVTRRQIFLSDGEGISSVFGVVLHILDELGVGQEYQTYFTSDLAGTMPTDKAEIVVGLDLLNRDSFLKPIREELQIFEDMNLHRQRRGGVYGWKEIGFSVLNSTRCILGAL